MEKRFDIEYLDIAINDLKEILDFISLDNVQAARVLLDKIDHSIDKLSFFPEMGVIPKDNKLKKSGYRILIVEDYLVFYIFKNEKIEIRRVIYGRRNYEYLLVTNY